MNARMGSYTHGPVFAVLTFRAPENPVCNPEHDITPFLALIQICWARLFSALFRKSSSRQRFARKRKGKGKRQIFSAPCLLCVVTVCAMCFICVVCVCGEAFSSPCVFRIPSTKAGLSLWTAMRVCAHAYLQVDVFGTVSPSLVVNMSVYERRYKFS